MYRVILLILLGLYAAIFLLIVFFYVGGWLTDTDPRIEVANNLIDDYEKKIIGLEADIAAKDAEIEDLKKQLRESVTGGEPPEIHTIYDEIDRSFLKQLIVEYDYELFDSKRDEIGCLAAKGDLEAIEAIINALCAEDTGWCSCPISQEPLKELARSTYQDDFEVFWKILATKPPEAQARAIVRYDRFSFVDWYGERDEYFENHPELKKFYPGKSGEEN